MREILFRGKDELGQWLYGGFVRGEYPYVKSFENSTTSYIVYTDDFCRYIPVVAETVGQFTGLTDKNGKKIFEGDIVKFSYNENDKEPKFYSVEWKKDRACFGYAETADKMIEIDCFHCEVIGNIHDNPELLETE